MRKLRGLTWLVWLLLTACGGGVTVVDAGLPPVGEPAKVMVVHDDLLYSISLPEGWAKVTEGGSDPRLVGYVDPTGGNFLVVWIWPESSFNYGGYKADQTWILDWEDKARSRLRVSHKEPMCDPDGVVMNFPGGVTRVADRFCLAGDGQLLIHAKVDFERAFSRGHQFQFEFGHAFSESGSGTELFETILRSFVVK